jgi:multidrug efflux pump subunit AcrA (membrane-fusion protein)
MLRPTTAVLAVLCAGAIVTAVLVIGPASSPTSAATERTATVSKGVVQSTVSGSGNLEPARQLDLNFGTAGTVTKISVKEGDKVTSGQVLARLDDADARVGLDKAQAALESAEADLDAAESGQATGSSSASNASVAATTDDTRVSYLTVDDETPTETTATTTTPTTTPAQTTQGATSATPSGSASGGSGTSGGGSSQTAAQKAAAIATAQANVDQARLDVEDAEQALEDTVLRAPTAGTVTSLTGAVGDDVSAGSASAAGQSGSGSSSSATGATAGGGTTGGSTSSSFITLSKLDRMQLTVSFTESDIGQVKVGQSATVSLSALSDVQLSGRVTQVAQVGTSSSGVVSYPVTIVLGQSARGVKAGMTASAEVIVKQASGLTLPSQAVTGRGTTGVVQVKLDGETVSKRVGIGLQGDSSTLITSGLEAGDEVVIESTPAITGGGSAGQQGSGTLSRSGLSGGGFPTGGGFPGGGGFGPPSGGGFGGRGG